MISENSKKHISIAIDGPSGVGKTTLAKNLAAELHFIYVDTGAIYRTLAVYLLDLGLDPEDEKGIEEALPGAQVSIRYIDGAQRMFLNDRDVTDRLRTGEVSHMASVSSSYPAVREKLLGLQRDLASSADVIMDGRDIGTVVLPDADIKIFLTAEKSVRAERRYLELKEKGTLGRDTVEKVARDLFERDERDSKRAASPLRAAEDAIVLDSSGLTAEEVQAIVAEKARKLVAAEMTEEAGGFDFHANVSAAAAAPAAGEPEIPTDVEAGIHSG